MTESLIQDVLVLLTAAQKTNASKSFIDEQFTKALDKMELLKEIEEAEEDVNVAATLHHQLLAFQFRIHQARKEYDRALEVARKSAAELRRAVLNRFAIDEHLEQIQFMPLDEDDRLEIMDKLDILAKNPSSLPSNHISAMLKGANIMVLQEDWELAMMTFQNVLHLYPDDGQCEPLQQFDVFLGLSRCFYECRNYKAAIEFGLEAVTMNPYLPGSRQYVVLAYLAMGNQRRKAEKCAAEAVIYEAPWDEEHQAKMREFYRQHFLKR
jgi:tetratricopeptide (TPR) repeat protein